MVDPLPDGPRDAQQHGFGQALHQGTVRIRSLSGGLVGHGFWHARGRRRFHKWCGGRLRAGRWTKAVRLSRAATVVTLRARGPPDKASSDRCSGALPCKWLALRGGLS